MTFGLTVSRKLRIYIIDCTVYSTVINVREASFPHQDFFNVPLSDPTTGKTHIILNPTHLAVNDHSLVMAEYETSDGCYSEDSYSEVWSHHFCEAMLTGVHVPNPSADCCALMLSRRILCKLSACFVSHGQRMRS